MKTEDQKKGAAGSCDTVKVKSEVSEGNPHGFVVIDAEDFDAAKHEPFDAPEKADKPADEKPSKAKKS